MVPVIIVQVTLPIPSHSVTSNCILVFKILHLNILNIVILYNLRVFLGDHPTILVKNYTIFKAKLSKSTLEETNILWFQLCVVSKMEYLTVYLSVL